MSSATRQEHGAATRRPTSRLIGRLLDRAVAGLILVLALPLLLLALVGSWIVFRVNPFFVQERVGRYGMAFRVPKVRSLPPVVPSQAAKHELNAYDVPPWGRFLRGTHLDELPQLLCVATGSMSLVGPRPEIPRLAARFDPEFAAARVSVRPGVTGLWQISEAASGLICEAPEYDYFYLANRSFGLDVWILWRTFRQYLPGGRPITLDDIPVGLVRCPASLLLQQPAERADQLAMVIGGGGGGS